MFSWQKSTFYILFLVGLMHHLLNDYVFSHVDISFLFMNYFQLNTMFNKKM